MLGLLLLQEATVVRQTAARLLRPLLCRRLAVIVRVVEEEEVAEEIVAEETTEEAQEVVLREKLGLAMMVKAVVEATVTVEVASEVAGSSNIGVPATTVPTPAAVGSNNQEIDAILIRITKATTKRTKIKIATTTKSELRSNHWRKLNYGKELVSAQQKKKRQ